MPNSQDYPYANPIPGSQTRPGQPPANIGGQVPDNLVVATGPQVVTTQPFRSAVAGSTESGQFDGNAAFSTASELQRGKGGGQDGFNQAFGNQNPEAPEPQGAGDRDNPVANENLGDSETQLRGEGLGDALAGRRPAIGAPRADGLTVTQTPST